MAIKLKWSFYFYALLEIYKRDTTFHIFIFLNCFFQKISLESLKRRFAGFKFQIRDWSIWSLFKSRPFCLFLCVLVIFLTFSEDIPACFEFLSSLQQMTILACFSRHLSMEKLSASLTFSIILDRRRRRKLPIHKIGKSFIVEYAFYAKDKYLIECFLGFFLQRK